MESYEKKIKERRFLERYDIEKSIEGTVAYYIDQDIQKGESEDIINEKLYRGIYANGNIIKSETDDLVKAISPDSLIRGIEDFKVSKKGKDIKTALGTQLAGIESKQQTLMSEMNALKLQIKEEPTQDFCANHSYMCDGMLDKTNIPKEYGYNQDKVMDSASSQSYVYQEPVNKDVQRMKSQYDDKLYSYVNRIQDIQKMNTIINNIDDNKTYNLNAQLASKLGF